MSKRCSDRLGETFETDEGYIITIVEYNNANDVVVEFNDKYKARIRTRYDVCRKGNLRNPYNISIHNVGYIGLNKDGSKPLTSIRNQITREYGLWYRMMSRCYSEYELKRRPTYKDCEVCKRWHCYANFLEDLPLIEGYDYWLNNPNERIALDKDIKGNGSKLYSLDTCVFVTIQTNNEERIERCGTNIEPTPVYGINIKTGERIDFVSQAEAKKHGFINIQKNLKGQTSHCGGYKWYYLKGDDVDGN